MMTLSHLFSFAVVDYYGKPDTSFHLPWIFKLSLIGLGIRAFVWLLNQMPKENKSLRKQVRPSVAPAPVVYPTAPVTVEPAVAREILVLKDGQEYGPYPVEEINRQLSSHVFDLSDFAWHEGLTEWQPLSSIAGVAHGHAHGLRPPPPPVTPGWSTPPSNSSAVSAPTGGLLVGGYICAVLALWILPPVLGLAGIVCGVVAIKRQQAGKGVPLLIVSGVCAVVGMIIGAAVNS